MKNNLDKQYQQLLQDILDYGIDKQDRTGTGTKSLFGYTIRHNMKDGFPLLTTKKMAWKTMVTELLWFLRGDTNIKYLVDNDCNIWTGDAYKSFKNSFPIKKSNPPKDYINEDGQLLTQEQFINKIKTDDKFAKQWGELGPIYGKQWRNWNNLKWETTDKADPSHPGRPMLRWELEGIDQIQNLINDLKTNPDSRRLMVNAWNVGELDQMVLPPCHYGFQLYTRELNLEEKQEQYTKSGLNIEINGTPLELKHMGTPFYPKSLPQRAISLMWNQRSVDTFLGLPFNIASYGLLLEIIAKEVNMVPDQLIGSLGDVHLYSNHIEQAKEQIGRKLTYEERVELLRQAMGEEFEKTFEQPIPPLSETKSYFSKYKIHPALHTREPFPLPTLRISSGPLDDIAHHEIMDFDILNYQSHPAIKAPLSN
jgi:thymidylate synthase